MKNQEALKQFDTSYKFGFVTDIESDRPKKGLNENTIEYISKKKKEPKWMLKWRLKAFTKWKTMKEPTWANISFPNIDYQDIYYYAAPKGFEKKIKLIEKEITLFHAKAVNEILKKSKVNIDFIGFHGQTIFHNAREKISKQL